jgi:hypothetical protein
MENKMPLMRCTENGKPGWSWTKNKCFTYKEGSESSEKAAKKKAIKMGIAIEGPDKFKQIQKSASSTSTPVKIVRSILDKILGNKRCCDDDRVPGQQNSS